MSEGISTAINRVIMLGLDKCGGERKRQEGEGREGREGGRGRKEEGGVGSGRETEGARLKGQATVGHRKGTQWQQTETQTSNGTRFYSYNGRWPDPNAQNKRGELSISPSMVCSDILYHLSV